MKLVEKSKIETIELPKPIGGINNIAKETDIPKGFLRSALNVDIDKEGNVSRRRGYTKIYSGINCHSIYNGFFAEGSLIKYIDADEVVTTLFGFSSNDPVSYCTLNDNVILTNGTVIARITADHTAEYLAPANPVFQPAAEMDIGTLSGGAYQYALCSMSEFGTLSGTGKAKVIELSHGAGIKFTNLAVSEEEKVLFISEPNGTVLYLRVILPADTTEYVLGNLGDKGMALDTQFLDALPAGHIVRTYRGKVYVAQGNVVWYSQAHRYGLCKTSEDFFQFPSRVTIMETVENGIFIVADKTYFLSGRTAEDINLVKVSKETGIEGTSTRVAGKQFGLDLEQDVAYWVSNKGMILGFPDGKVKNITDKNIAIDINIVKGSSMYREIDGKKQILTALNGGGDQSTFTSTDTLTSTIIRNGVEITE